jgi:hypothetical protein
MDDIKGVIEPLLKYTKIIGVTPYSFTTNGVRLSRLNILQIVLFFVFWIVYYIRQFLYMLSYEGQGDLNTLTNFNCF